MIKAQLAVLPRAYRSTMYRVKASDLCNKSLTDEQLGAKVENLGKTPKPDGMLESRDGSIYLAAFEQNAIARFNASSQKTSLVIQDQRLQWPDTIAWGPDGKLYVSASQIHRMPKYHGGQSQQQGPYRVFRMNLQ